MRPRLSGAISRRPSIDVARALLTRARDVGADLGALLTRCGISASVDDFLQGSWNEQLTTSQFVALYQSCMERLETFDSRRQARAPMMKTDVDFLCYCVINCSSLREVVQRTATFCSLLDERAGVITLTKSGLQTEFRMRTVRRRRDATAMLADLVGLSTYHTLFCWLIGEDIAPVTADLCYAPLIEEDLIAALFPHPVRYNREDNILRFPEYFLHRPVVRSYGELLIFLKTFPFDVTAVNSRKTPVSEIVGQLINAALSRRETVPTASAVARQLNISAATLKRQLASEGVSLQQLKDEKRHTAAIQLLQDVSLPLGDIASRLGFSDASAFSRAFKTWVGVTPGRYRENSYSR